MKRANFETGTAARIVYQFREDKSFTVIIPSDWAKLLDQTFPLENGGRVLPQRGTKI